VIPKTRLPAPIESLHPWAGQSRYDVEWMRRVAGINILPDIPSRPCTAASAEVH